MTFEYVSRVPPEGGDAQEMLCVSGASFRLNPIMIPDDGAMMFSVWCKADAPTQIEVIGASAQHEIDVPAAWRRVSVGMEEAGEIAIAVGADAEVLFYRAQLEAGNRVTDWRPAPEDADDDIEAAISAANTAQNAADTLRNDVDAQLVSFKYEQGALFIYPRSVEDPSKIDINGYHLRLSNGSLGFQKGTELYPDLKLRPNSWIFGGTLYFRTADGGIAHRAVTPDDYV